MIRMKPAFCGEVARMRGVSDVCGLVLLLNRLAARVRLEVDRECGKTNPSGTDTCEGQEDGGPGHVQTVGVGPRTRISGLVYLAPGWSAGDEFATPASGSMQPGGAGADTGGWLVMATCTRREIALPSQVLCARQQRRARV